MTEQCNIDIQTKTTPSAKSDNSQTMRKSSSESVDNISTTDTTDNYVKGSYRYRCEKFDYTESDMTISNRSISNAREPNARLNISNNIQIPIVGYEVMEERARFTVYKLRIENKNTGDCWYVFRRYTDFVRLCSKLKQTYPELSLLMPKKKWFGNNFDPNFLEERIQGLQTFVNAIVSMPELMNSQQIQDFFCLNEPPVYSDSTEESRAIFEALEDTIYHLRHQLKEKESNIDNLQSRLSSMSMNLQSLKKFIQTSTENCKKCSKEYENFKKTCDTSSSCSSS